MSAFWLCVSLLGGVAVAQESNDEDQERAKVLFAQGQQLYDQGRYEEAVDALELAYKLSGKPRLLFNLTAPLERLGRWTEALDAMERYQPHAKDYEVEEVERRLETLRARVAEEQAQADALAAASAASQKSGPPVGAWVLFGTGAVGLGTGTVFTARALGARSEWTSLCAGDPGICPGEAAPFYDRDRSSSVIADVAFTAGVVALASGAVVTLATSRQRAREAQLALYVAPGAVGLGGAF